MKFPFEKYVLYEIGSKTIVVSRNSGDQIMIPSDFVRDPVEFSKILSMQLPELITAPPAPYSSKMIKTVYMSLHGSSRCNLACRYCFMKEREKREISFEEAKTFMDMIINRFPDAGKFIVDPTGSGEPLLRIDFMEKIADYCHRKSDEISKEILPMLVTNGTLLSKENVSILQRSGFIFGVSMDGYKKIHDSLRVFPNGKGTFDRVLKNVKAIKHRDFLGVAVTITGENTNLVKILRQLIRYFPTISMKPVRSIDENIQIGKTSIPQLKESYDALYVFLLKKTLHGALEYLSALLNGDDYFGKFLLRVFLNYKVITRCDAGLGRFSLSPSQDIYACPGAIGIEPMIIGNMSEGLSEEKTKEIWESLSNREKCRDCEAKFVCGGECLVVSFYSGSNFSTKDPFMCELKRHLFELAVRIKFQLMENRPDLYRIILEGCNRKQHRFDQDIDLANTLEKVKGKYSFLQLKHLKDDHRDLYDKIKEGYNID